LTYAGARYYAQDIGRFTRIDPVSFKIASSGELEQENNVSALELLARPQSLNNYSYSLNNPIVYVDPDGELFDFIIDIGFTLYDLGNIVYQFITNGSVDTSEWTNLGLDAGSIFIPGVAGLGMVKRITAKVAEAGVKIYVKASEIKNIIKSADKAYDVAKNGGKHFGEYKNYVNRTDRELVDSVASHMKNVEEHIDKLANPEKYIDDFANKTERDIQGQLNQWKTHLLNNQEKANIKSGILKERIEKHAR